MALAATLAGHARGEIPDLPSAPARRTVFVLSVLGSAMSALSRLIPLALATLALAGCAGAPVAPEPPVEAIVHPAPAPAPEPTPTAPAVVAPATPDTIADAPERSQLSCTSEGVLAAGQVPGELSYRCDGLEESVTLDELREAGWRLEQMGIGVRAEVGGETGLPLSISVRKLH